MSVYYQDESVTLFHGDALEVLRRIPDSSVDAVVTDPPYGLEFMGKDWDAPWKPSSVGRGARVATERSAEMTPRGAGHSTPAGPFLAARVDSTRVAGKPFQEWCQAWAAECLRVLKPGGHMVAFGGTRTFHRLTAGVEDAGFEIRDVLSWLYGSGFPKSMNVAKAVDAHVSTGGSSSRRLREVEQAGDGEAYTPGGAASEWEGWGTALKPAWEPIIVARKPLAGTVAANVLEHGTGALNIDACRVPMSEGDAAAIDAKHAGMNVSTYERPAGASLNLSVNPMALKRARAHEAGRFPANVILDSESGAALDAQSGESVSRRGKPRGAAAGTGWGMTATGAEYDDEGGASRFFYSAKASAAERPVVDGVAHPTVKPLALMEWLIELVTRPGGTVLEPFAGSGTTLEAAQYTGRSVIGVEREADYLPLIDARLTRKDPRLAVPRPTAQQIEGQGAFDFGEAS